ncbi:PadR family transcriptional regulator [uncultured Microbacterium sp.]|uniref:PadR family transcriptional regulator n=1 Tax=uncultured Microbacterium sp. TaxID=191216 RepID=UPI0025F52A29|nr:PadR family transcriptional regulator [uncultured Microbacterium sp.]
MTPEDASSAPRDASIDATAQLRRGVIEHGILAALAREPMYGWQLAERLTELGLIAGIGTLYPVLGRMRDRGAIEAFERPSVTGPVRKYYAPTPAGAAELRAFRTQWRQFARTVDALLGEQR